MSNENKNIKSSSFSYSCIVLLGRKHTKFSLLNFGLTGFFCLHTASISLFKSAHRINKKHTNRYLTVEKNISGIVAALASYPLVNPDLILVIRKWLKSVEIGAPLNYAQG